MNGYCKTFFFWLKKTQLSEKYLKSAVKELSNRFNPTLWKQAVLLLSASLELEVHWDLSSAQELCGPYTKFKSILISKRIWNDSVSTQFLLTELGKGASFTFTSRQIASSKNKSRDFSPCNAAQWPTLKTKHSVRQPFKPHLDSGDLTNLSLTPNISIKEMLNSETWLARRWWLAQL